MNSELRQYYRNLREQNRRLSERRAEECDQKSPRFRSLANERGLVLQQLAAKKITAANAKARIGNIRADRQRLLTSLGLPGNYLDPIFTCSVCKDTGEVGDEPKQLCACALKRMQTDLYASARINDRETFASFRTDIYPSDAERKQAVAACKYIRAYADALPHPQKPNLVLLGDSGCGKSFFGNAVAYEAISRGIETRKVTSYRLIHEVLDHIGKDGDDPLNAYLSYPFLVIDDLGTEPTIQNISLETLFCIVNERLSQQLPTVYISNLPAEAMKDFYDERMISRLFDKSSSTVLLLRGENLRTRIR